MRIKIAGFMFVVALLIAVALPLFAGSATVYAHGGEHTSCAGGAPAAVAGSGGAFIPGPSGKAPDGGQISSLAISGSAPFGGEHGFAATLNFAHFLVCEPN